jgi:hypothetical protein
MSNMNITDITIEDYSEKAIVVRGETRPHKDKIKELGGTWNAKLRDGPGWIFPKTKRSAILQWLSTGTVVPDTPRRNNVETRQVVEENMLEKITRNMDKFSISELMALKTRIDDTIRQRSSENIEDVVEELEDSEEEVKPPRKSLLRK